MTPVKTTLKKKISLGLSQYADDSPTKGEATPTAEEPETDPDDLGDWKELTDPSSGDSYFWNPITNQTTWDRPVIPKPKPKPEPTATKEEPEPSTSPATTEKAEPVVVASAKAEEDEFGKVVLEHEAKSIESAFFPPRSMLTWADNPDAGTGVNDGQALASMWCDLQVRVSDWRRGAVSDTELKEHFARIRQAVSPPMLPKTVHAEVKAMFEGATVQLRHVGRGHYMVTFSSEAMLTAACVKLNPEGKKHSSTTWHKTEGVTGVASEMAKETAKTMFYRRLHKGDPIEKLLAVEKTVVGGEEKPPVTEKEETKTIPKKVNSTAASAEVTPTAARVEYVAKAKPTKTKASATSSSSLRKKRKLNKMINKWKTVASTY